MNLAAWCIKNDRTAFALFALILLAGMMSFVSISRSEDPDFTIRVAVIVTPFPGAAPKRVEELVTDKIEEKIREMPQVKNIQSQSMTGVSVVRVEFQHRYKDMGPIWQKMRNKVDDAAALLPPEAGRPQVNDEYGDVYGILIAVTGSEYSMRELKDVADNARDILKKVKGVGKVERVGVIDERVFVEFSNARLAEFGFTPYQLAAAIDTQNAITPGGDVIDGPERIGIEPTGVITNLDELRNLSLRLPGKDYGVALSDVASISRGYVDPPDTLVRYNGQPAILLGISMVKGGNIMELGERVTTALQTVESETPLGIDLNVFMYQPEHVERAVSDFMMNLLESFGFVFVVMLIFAGWRIGLIAGSLVPMAMLACLALMPMFDVGLQRISIASLIISLGILVDNGVVVSENILVRLVSGQDRYAAVTEAVQELWMPLMAASLTTIFAFLPIPLAQSEVGEYCASIFVVVTLTLGASWLLSLTMVPMLCYRFLKPKVITEHPDSMLMRFYRWILGLALRNKTLFLLFVGVACAVAIWGFQFVPKMFFPPNERPQLLIDFWQPYGTDVMETSRRAALLEEFLLQDPETKSVGSFVGFGGPRWDLTLFLEEQNTSLATMVVNTKTIDGVDGLLERADQHLKRTFPDASYSLKKLMNGPPVGAAVQIRLSGEDIPSLYRIRDRIAALLKERSDITRVWDDWGEWTKKLVLNVDQERGRKAGLSSEDIALSMMTETTGLHASDYREGDTIIPILLRSEQSLRHEPDRLVGLNVYAQNAGAGAWHSVPLLQVADPELVWQPSNIRRRDQTRTITIKADVAAGAFASQVLADVAPQIDAMRSQPDWPTGFFVEYGGEHEKSDESQASINANMPLAMGLLVLTLIAQFNSLRRPIIILLTLPPMICGITAGMLLTNAPFGFMAMLGMISLLGIIVNNAIMLIDRIEILRGQGMSVADAVYLAAQQRVRPILMTTITTVIGMLPLSLQGGEMWRPMANCIISGLSFATVLTLLLCPVLYMVFMGRDTRPVQNAE
ncbi:efflux RND transporter permease subunit [Desulfovibrio inopinatus]|uniref:efflux RND transporter permease subunit n=1 Tax=Desulfovibrio inopinatus TaxID=102109 RepID=UPI00040F0B7D|nr:efflux RND transporter permease subunit [Desulfovibrio inopinatus]